MNASTYETGISLDPDVPLVRVTRGSDAIIASGMEHGVREGYERLDELLAG